MTCKSGIDIWERLKQVSSLSFTAQSANRITGWNGTGLGIVKVENGPGECIIFSETGTWKTTSGVEMAFSNRYRWSLSGWQDCLKLAHLRYGDESPVKLLELYSDTGLRWKTSTPHTCNKDTYTLEILCSSACMSLDWNIVGPVKNERIYYQYQ